MKQSNNIDELCNWLIRNKIQFSIVDEEVVNIVDFGLTFYVNTAKSGYKFILKKDKDGELVFNIGIDAEELVDEGIKHVAFKFGDNMYYHTLGKEFKLNILKFIGRRTDSQLPFSCEFVNLGVHTPYELLNGSFMPDMWVRKAKYLGHKALGICDRNTMAACFAFQKECAAAEITPVFGYSLTVKTDDGYKFNAKVYVQTQKGLRNLLRIQKAIMVDNIEHKTIDFGELLKRGEGNVLVIGKLDSEILADKYFLSSVKKAFRQVYYQVDLSEYKAERIDIKVLEATKHYFERIYNDQEAPRPILISDCYYLDKDNAKNKVILNKIAEGAAHEQSDDQYFKDIDEHYAVFEQLFSDKWDVQAIFKECCRNTVVLAEGAEARMDTTRNYMPKYDMTPEEKAKYGTTHNMFNQILEDGLMRLAPKDRIDEYRKQMEYEKYIIESTDNVDYLLVQYDTCNWARRNNILVGCGRGSAAGSLLLYLMGITLIDPIKYNLIFERFLLPERAGYFPAKTTIIGEDIDSIDYMELTLENGKNIKVDKDAEFMIKRGNDGELLRVYADELKENDDIIFDNKDILFTINEL